jgi:hypothetical protein
MSAVRIIRAAVPRAQDMPAHLSHRFGALLPLRDLAEVVNGEALRQRTRRFSVQ